MMTSAAIAERLGTSAVMVRRVFGALHGAGFLVQRKGPSGGARLKVGAKEIGLGDVFAATAGDWLSAGERGLDAALARAQKDAVQGHERDIAGGGGEAYPKVNALSAAGPR